MQNKKIAVVVGGTSSERAVSKQSGESIYKAVKSLGYDVKVIDPAYGLNQPLNVEDFFSDCEFGPISNKNYIKTVNSKLFEDVDLAFIALHGKYGEDGTIQSLFELAGIKYTGSDVLGSSLTMDKARSKVMFKHFGVDTPRWTTANKNSDKDNVRKIIESEFGIPFIVKPNDQGSTIGFSKCENLNQLDDALDLALQYSSVALIEEYIEGREIAVAIVNNKIFPLLEIRPKHEIYDYECKYTDGMSEYLVPAPLDPKTEEFLKMQAKTAFDSLGCKDYGRVDFRLTKNNKSFCFEVNTLPGMTSHSLVPKMAKAAGISFEELIQSIVKFFNMKKLYTKKDRLITWLYLVILIFLILFLFFNKYGLLKYFELKSEIDAIEREIERSKNEIEVLDSSINALDSSDSELEKVAREKFMMKKKNEKVFKFEDKKDTLD